MSKASRIFTDTESFYIRSMGKLLQVTAIFTSDDDANAYMERNDSAAVVANCGPFVFIANKWDKGEQ